MVNIDPTKNYWFPGAPKAICLICNKECAQEDSFCIPCALELSRLRTELAKLKRKQEREAKKLRSTQ
jgi:hypothetical protein